MSYSLLAPCHRCDKKETCKDYEKIQKAITEIHNTTYEEGHQGSGFIKLECQNLVSVGPIEPCPNITMNFGKAFEEVKNGKGMRLPGWSSEVVIRAQYPDENSKMTAPYLYVESRFGKVPWKETMIELFSNDWVVVD